VSILDTLRRTPQLIRFAFVGCIGFCVDTTVLYTLLYAFGSGYYVGRLISYLCAASTTWICNRYVTFFESRSDNLLAEWARFLFFSAGGGGVNYAAYAVVIHFSDHSRATPALGIAAGSLAGLMVNYSLSKWFVFRTRPAQT
jgi:putative flippase GtrA